MPTTQSQQGSPSNQSRTPSNPSGNAATDTKGDHSSRIEELREHTAAVGAEISALATTAGALATDQLDPIRNYVKDAPMKSLLIAAGAGALLTLILRR